MVKMYVCMQATEEFPQLPGFQGGEQLFPSTSRLARYIFRAGKVCSSLTGGDTANGALRCR